MAFNMQCQSGYQNNNSVSKSAFNFRSPAAINLHGPGPLQPHSSQIHAVVNSKNAALKMNSNPYNKGASTVGSTSNYFNNKNVKKPFENNDQSKKYDIVRNNWAGNYVIGDIGVNEKVREAPIVRAFTGNVDKLIKWHKLLNSSHIIYEVIGCVIQMQPGAIAQQRIMLMRSCVETGPVLQIVYYHLNDRINISDFYIGQKLRCVGQMIGTNMLRAHSIRDSTPQEVSRLSRLQAISDRSVSTLIK